VFFKSLLCYLKRKQPLSKDGGCFSLLGLLTEGHAIGALIFFGIALMSADLHAVQAAIILTAAVVLAGGYGAVDAAVCFFHNHDLLSADLVL
jgi:hypothetical protein